MIKASEELLEFCKNKSNWSYGPSYYWDFIVESNQKTENEFWENFWRAPGLLGPFLDSELTTSCSIEDLEGSKKKFYGVLQLVSGVQTAFFIACIPMINEDATGTKFRAVFKPRFVKRVASRSIWNLTDNFSEDEEAMAFHHSFLRVLSELPVLCAYAGDQAWCQCVCSYWPKWRGHLVYQRSFQADRMKVDDSFCAIKLTDLARH